MTQQPAPGAPAEPSSAPPPPISKHQWRQVTKRALATAFVNQWPTMLAEYPASYQQHFTLIGIGPQDLHVDSLGYPPFVKLGGTFAPIGLRFLAYALRPLPFPRQDHDRPDCLWCGLVAGECGVHLVECPALPDLLAAPLDQVLVSIWLEAYQNRRPSPAEAASFPLDHTRRTAAFHHLRRLAWPHLTQATLRLTLAFVGKLINQYRVASEPPPRSGLSNPIWSIHVPHQ